MAKVYKGAFSGTLPITVSGTGTGVLASYKIFGNTGGVGTATENLIDVTDISDNGYLDSNGQIRSSANYHVSQYISVEPDTDYVYGTTFGTYVTNVCVVEYDDAYQFVRGTSFGSEIASVKLHTRTNTRYVRCSIRIVRQSTTYLVKGTDDLIEYIPYGYKLPILSNDTTTDIYIGDTALAKDEYADSETGKIYRYVDEALTPTDPPAPLPEIPTFAGTTVIDYAGEGLAPSQFDGVAGWGNLPVKKLNGVPYTGTLPATLTGTKAGYLHRYKIYGNTEQTGTPTPENPIMPEGVGERTENLFDAATAYGNMYDSATGTLVGAASSLTTMRNKFDSSMVGVPITISIHADDVPVTRVYIRCTIGGTNVDSNAIANGKTGIMTVTVTPTSVNDDWRITFGTGAGDITLSDIMLNLGSTPLPYVPFGYKLPILSNSTITDIYLGEAETTRKIRKIEVEIERVITLDNGNKGGVTKAFIGKNAKSGLGLCNKALYGGSSVVGGFYVNRDNAVFVGSPTDTLNDFKSKYDGASLWYILATEETAVVNEPLMKIGDYADTIDSTQTTARIPTVAGETIIDYGAAALLKVKANGGDISTYTGTLPAALQTVAGYLESYKIWGNTGGVGAETENLCDKVFASGYNIASNGLPISYTPNNSRCATLEAIDVSNQNTVTFSYTTTVSDNKHLIYSLFNGNTLVAREAGGLSGTTIDVARGNKLYLCVYSNLASVDAAETTSNIMLNSGSTALPYEPYGYKLPILSNDATTDIFIGDNQLAKGEYVDSETGQIYRYVDGTLTPTDTPAPLPQIPTAAGKTTIDYGIAALPYPEGLDGVFEYGDIDGLTWKNSVSGENDIIFDAAVTDTGSEYVLPAGASGQHTSKSGEYRTAFTWYCIAKCPTTCHAAGQYMISDLGNGIGVEISSGWAAYSSAGGNHLVRGVDNRDYNSQMPVTSYALIAVAGDVNGVASVYVNGVKMTDSWNFNPVSSSGAATVFLGKRASGQLSGTEIDYKFLAFGTVKQTDAEIIANSQYLMTKYLGVGRPEKVELDVHGGAGSDLAPSEFDSIQEWVDIPTYTRVNGKWVANFETIIYGFHVDPSISDPANAVTYLLDAVGKTPATNSSSVVDYSDWADAFFMPKPCMLNYDGTVAYYLDPNDYTKKADGSPSDVANPLFPGNAMMEWPVIWWKFEAGEVEGEMSFYVSNRQVDSTYHCWCNIDAENHITDHFYTAIYNGTSATTYSDSDTYAVDDLVTYSSAEYKCTTAVETPEAFDSNKWEKVSDVTRLRSLSGKALTAANGNGSTTGTVEVQRATANNTTATVEWYTDVFSDRQLINGLLTLVSKTLDSSAVYGRGLDLSGRATKEAYITGTLDDKGLFWGNPSAGTSAKKCFGMENWDGCVWHRTAGLIGSSSTGGYAYKLTYNTADGSTATSYNSTGSGYLVGATGDGTTIARPASGYVTAMKVASATGIWLPGTVGGSTSTYYCDYYYNGSDYGLAGGNSGIGAGCGCWYLYLNVAFDIAGWYIDASPSCKPLASRWKVFEGGDS